MKENTFKVEYYCGARVRDGWIVVGPGIYTSFDGDQRHTAYEWAAKLNSAYMLGYVARILEEKGNTDGQNEAVLQTHPHFGSDVLHNP
jgi:hypothetical protein